MGRLTALLMVLVAVLLSAAPSSAHETRPAYLEITEQTKGRYQVVWKRPIKGNRTIAIAPKIAPACRTAPLRSRAIVGAVVVQRWNFVCGGEGLRGRLLTIAGLKLTITDVMVRIAHRGGDTETIILRPSSASYRIKGVAPWTDVAASYLAIGVEHILGGIDHLLFVLCLLLLVTGTRRLIETVTAFTLAHSLTLCAAALGLVTVPQRAVEAVIALSIVFLATEVVKKARGVPSLTQRKPWIVAFTFGLLHGFGFAGALREIGLPQGDIPLALLTFNLGVEAGQLMFVAVVLGVLWAVRQLKLPRPAVATTAAGYLIGVVATYWLFERVTGLAA